MPSTTSGAGMAVPSTDDAAPSALTRRQRLRNWADFNHILGTVIGLAGLTVGVPAAFAIGLPLIYPVIAVITGLSMCVGPTWIPVGSDRIDRPVGERVSRLMRELCTEIGCTEPRVYVALTKIPNAAATSLGGRGRMVVNTGLLDRLDDREVKAVLAHEMGHIRQRHLAIIRIATLPLFFVDLDRIAAAGLALVHLTSAPGLIVSTAAWCGFLGVFNGGMRLAERSADSYSARVTHDPLALASALTKIAGQPVSLREKWRAMTGPQRVRAVPLIALAYAARFLLASHPSVGKRVGWLEKKASASQNAPGVVATADGPERIVRRSVDLDSSAAIASAQVATPEPQARVRRVGIAAAHVVAAAPSSAAAATHVTAAQSATTAAAPHVSQRASFALGD